MSYSDSYGTCGHFIMKCKFCDATIAQCRCPSKEKEVRHGVCKQCSDEGKEEKLT